MRPPRLRCTLFPLIYPPHLLVLPATFGLHLLLQTYPYFRASYVISVRRTKSLPTASFRFHLTMDTLAVRLYTSSLPRRVRDFHPLERAHGAQTKCLHFKRKCRHHPHSILDILPVYLTRGISYHTAGGLFVFQSFVFQNNEKLHNVKQGLALVL